MRKTLLAALAVGLVGCVGGIESGGGTGPDPLETGDGDGNDNGDNPAGGDLTAAKQLFDEGVFPLVQKCGGIACHAESAVGATLTRFVADDAARGWQVATNYTALVGNYVAANAGIITYIDGRNHQAMPDWSATEKAAITAWLDKELELRSGQPTDPGTGGTGGTETLAQATERVLSEWAGCMTLENFNAANMAQAWGAMQAQNNQECDNCHSNGDGGFFATRYQPGRFFEIIQTKKYFFLQYMTVDLTNGAAEAKIVINDMSMRGVANGQDPHREHPRFNADNNQGRNALLQFYNATMQRKQNGECDPPKPMQSI